VLLDTTAFSLVITQENFQVHHLHQMEHQHLILFLELILTNQMEDMITFNLMVMVMKELQELKRLIPRRLRSLNIARREDQVFQESIAEKTPDQSVRTIRSQRVSMRLSEKK